MKILFHQILSKKDLKQTEKWKDKISNCKSLKKIYKYYLLFEY